MAIFNNDDRRSLGYKERDEVIEKVMESYGFVYSINAIQDKKTYNLKNEYQVFHWNRQKKGFLKSKYKDFSIMEFDNKITKFYYPYICINHRLYISFPSLHDTGITYDELSSFANGFEEHAKEESLATQILNSIKKENDLQIEKKKKEIEELEKIYGSDYVKGMYYKLYMERFLEKKIK